MSQPDWYQPAQSDGGQSSVPDWFQPPSADPMEEVEPPRARHLSRPTIDSATGHEARRAADRERGLFLTRVSAKELSLWQAVQIVASDPRPVLRKITLQRLLLESGYSTNQSKTAPKRTLALTGGSKKTSGPLNLAWLLDKRTGGMRVLALMCALRPQSDTPWPGYPFTPPPIDLDAIAASWMGAEVAA